MITSYNRLTLTLLALIPVSMGAASLLESKDAQSSSTAAALKTAARFHELLARGDSAGAVRLLASDATILESGDRETRAEYVAHHLGADIEFAKAVATTRQVVDTQRRGDVVWVAATSVSKGRFHDRPIDSRGAELMVLSRSGQRWLIRAIHWSSRRAGQ
jgi:ketosteroid isomerase-like protein